MKIKIWISLFVSLSVIGYGAENFAGEPAARLGDQTAHGTFLAGGPGSPNVIICGEPAWRAKIDIHVCPLVFGFPPMHHVGGPVLSGSSTVRINGFPAARRGDLIVEVGPPNVIAAGCATVLIGP